MASFLEFAWQVVSHHPTFLLGAAASLCLMREAFREGRRYQARRMRDMAARVRQGRDERRQATLETGVYVETVGYGE